MTVATIVSVVLITVFVVVGIITGLIWVHRDEIHQQTEALQAALQAWSIQQIQYEADRSLHEATKAAVEQTIAEATKDQRQ